MKNKTILVIAGDYRQFQNWFSFQKRLKGFENCKYIDSIDALYGYEPKGIKIILIGEYWKNRAYNSDRFQWLSKDCIVIKPSPQTGGEKGGE